MGKSLKSYCFSSFLLILPTLTSIFYTTNFAFQAETENIDKANVYLIKGEQLENLFPDSAIYYYQIGLQNLQGKLSYDESILKIQLYLKSGYVFHIQNKYSLASDYYLKALEEAILVEDDSLIAESNFNIAEIGLENGSYTNAIESYSIAKKKFEEINQPEGVFWSSIGLGIVYRELGNTELSKRNYEYATEIGEENNRKDYVAISYNNLGNLFKQIGEYDVALKYLQQSLKSFEIFGEEKFISDCLESIGEVYTEIGNNNRALEYFDRSTKIAESLGDSYRLLSRYANKAKIYSNMQDDENAIMYYSKTIELAQSMSDKGRLSEVLILISDYYRLKGDLNNALNQINESLRISEDVCDTVSIASAYNLLSELYFLQNEYSLAYQNALKSYQISSQKDLKKTLSESSSNLSKLLEIRGNFKDALFYFKIHERTKDFLLNTNKLKILEDTEAKYNLERIEREKLELENSALLREEKIAERNLLIILLLIAIITLAIFTSWYLKKRKTEKKENLEKSSEMKQKINLLNNRLNEKNRELTAKALLISQNNEILKEVVVSIGEYLNSENKDKSQLRRLKIQLQQIYEETSWDDFMQHFEQVHPQFYKSLLSKCDELSSMEQKICAFLKMKLNTKDISHITGQSIKAIEVMRSRIRKKLEIPHEESLTKTIQNI